MKPIIAVNFKTYKESTGKKAIKLAKELEENSKKLNIELILIVQPVDIYRISKAVSIPVYSEHLDPISYGPHTGKILPEALKENNAKGVLLNHAENRFRLDHLDESITRSREVKLKTMVCANDILAVKAIAEFNPDFIAIEPPELIGGDISVATAKPEIIAETVKAVNKINKNIKVLCGAGIKTNIDVKKALKLGAEGILVASGIIKTKNPGEKLKELCQF